MCYRCQHGPLATAEWERKALTEFGWFAHVVTQDQSDNTPTGFNYHTHGFPHTFDYYDIQIVYPFPDPKVAHNITRAFIEVLRTGARPADREAVADVLEDLPIRTVLAKECARPVMRLLLPDKSGRTDTDMDWPWKAQWADIELHEGEHFVDQRLDFYVVYEHPKDFPDRWVVRRHICRGKFTVADAGPYTLGHSLNEVRYKLPPGVACIGRMPTDDPAIHEVWV